MNIKSIKPIDLYFSYLAGLPFQDCGINNQKYSHSKRLKMKNSFKLGALALVIAVSFAACKGKGTATGDSVKTDSVVKVDSTVKKDSTVKVDTAKKDTTKKDTAAKK